MDDNGDMKNSDFVVRAVDSEVPVTQIESMCMNCHENGITTIMVTDIPHFRQVIISSFQCLECGFRNNSVQFGGTIQPQGVKIVCDVTDPKDLNRQIVKGEYCIIRIPELELEIPQETQKGTLNTVEGVLQGVIDDLEKLQSVRRVQVPEQAAGIEIFLDKAREYVSGKNPFTFIIDDLSGNSFVEDLKFPEIDPKLKVERYSRTQEQNKELGFFEADSLKKEQESTREQAAIWQEFKKNPKDKKSEQIFHSEWTIDNSTVITPSAIRATSLEDIYTISIPCFSCGHEGEENMIEVEIPYFKKIVIMSFVCSHCGYRNNQVKSTSEIADHGKRIILRVEKPEDLSRDLLKSDSCGMEIPEIDFELESGTLGGRFTTVEGILMEIHQQLSKNTFMTGDSASEGDRENWKAFLKRLSQLKALKEPFTLILDDPTSSSYIQSYTQPDPDPQMVIEKYTRSHEQNEFLGLIGMKTENYDSSQTDDQKAA